MENLTFTPVVETPVVPAQITSEEIAPKKGPGRPRKNPAPAAPASGSYSGKSAFEVVDKIAAETKNAEQATPAAPAPEVSGMKAVAGTFINGKMVLVILDIAFPMVFKVFMKELKKAPIQDLRLSPDQKEIIGPISDEVAAYVLKFLDPLTLFFICTGAMYYQNAGDALQKIKEGKK